ncbi:MAG: hypothetical protein LBR79_05125 [Oscillospiraceae bacterium]|jgi:hypothetical protein|nr:hypothetical protein [Oscillospiraceae bacterium]
MWWQSGTNTRIFCCTFRRVCFKCTSAERPRALAFGVNDENSLIGMDLGEFIPELKPLLEEEKFGVYVVIDGKIGVRPR